MGWWIVHVMKGSYGPEVVMTWLSEAHKQVQEKWPSERWLNGRLLVNFRIQGLGGGQVVKDVEIQVLAMPSSMEWVVVIN